MLAAGATGALALSAGCLGFVLGNEPLEFAAERVAPTDNALEDTGYGEQEIGEETIERSVELPGGVERDVRATVRNSTYSKAVEYRGRRQEGAVFAAVSIPSMTIAGRSLNPLSDMSNRELLGEFMSQVDGDGGEVRNVSHEESFALQILGDGRTVDAFVGESDLEGEPIEVEITMTSFEHEDDLIVLLGSLPRALTEESANVEVLMESVEHPA